MQRYGPSYNDITLRSQQFAADVQGAADARIQRSQEIMGQSFQNLGENIQQNIWRKRQMQQQQMQFQQQMAAEQQQFQMGFALKKADADMRLQMQAQEQQLNAYKLQQMLALDAVDMSQIQKDREIMTNEALRRDIEYKQRQMDDALGLNQAKKVADIIGKFDPYYITALGFKVDPSTGSLIPFASEEEKKAMQLSLQRKPARADDQSMIDRRDTMSAVQISKQIIDMEAMLANTIDYEWTPEQKAQIRSEITRLINMRDQMEQNLANPANASDKQPELETTAKLPDASQPAQAAPQTNPADFTAPLVGTPVRYNAGDQEKIAQWSNTVGIRDTRDPNLPGGEMSELLDPQTRQKVSKFIFDNQDNLYNAYKRGAAQGRESKVLDKETYLQNVVNSLGSAPSAYTRNILAVLYKANVITAEQAQAMGLQ